MQSAYIGRLMEIAEKDHNVLHILADSGTGYDEMFRRNFPDQIYNFGIAEENMVAAAAGMASVGKIPFVFTAGAFLAYRALEYIRDDVCFQNRNVKITGMGSGLSWSTLGPTHHTTEDLSVLRAMPGLMVLSPATPKQVSECVSLAYRHKGPVYIRLGMNREKEFYDSSYVISKGNDVIVDGNDIVVYSTGSILEEVVCVAEKLKEDNISAKVINVCMIKPFNVEDLIKNAPSRVFTVEEHNIMGGLGSIVAEAAAYNGLGIKVTPIGLNDCFASGYGTYKTVRKVNRLDVQGIYERIKGALDE